jgi:uncharacterized membrane protein YraQ (UPF0718 family)
MAETRLDSATTTVPPPPPLRRFADALARIDRVMLAIVAIFLALLALDAAQARASLGFTLDSLLFLAPFLAASVLVAALAKATGADGQIARFLSGHPVSTIAAAALFGALSPFCSCGVVPIVAGLLGAGVPLAPVMAFWIASPIMDPEMFILTAAVLGLPFAVAKTAAAAGMGLLAGFATHALAARPSFASPLLAGAGGCGSCCGKPKAGSSANG